MNKGAVNNYCNFTTIGQDCKDLDFDYVADYNNTTCNGGLDQCVELGLNFNPNFATNLVPNSSNYNFTNLTLYSDLRRINDFSINESNKPRIEFTNNVSLINLETGYCFKRESINLDLVFNITNTKITVLSEDYNIFNKPAIIYFYGTFVTPKILKDGIDCLSCEIISNGNGVVKINVSGFSTYEIVETYVPSNNPESNDHSRRSGGEKNKNSSLINESNFSLNNLNNNLNSSLLVESESNKSIQENINKIVKKIYKKNWTFFFIFIFISLLFVYILYLIFKSYVRRKQIQMVLKENTIN
jgi:hypothetical protein